MTGADRAPGAQARVTVVWQPDPGASAEDIADVRALPDRKVLDVVVALKVSSQSPAQPSDSGAVRICQRSACEFAVHVRGQDWATARKQCADIVLALIAHLRGMAYLRCTVASAAVACTKSVLLAEAPTGPGTGPLRLRGSHVLVDASSSTTVTAHIVAAGTLLREATVTVEAVPVGAVVLVRADPDSYMSPKAILPHLHARRGTPTAQLDAATTGPGGARLCALLDSATEAHLRSLSVAILSACVDAARLFDWAHSGKLIALIGPAPAQYPPAALAQVQVMQHLAAQVYGRLDPEHAIAWTTEELGEAAQAIRRRESPARIAEELGQLHNWVLCLANIAGVDLAACTDSALQHEARRQLSKHGGLRPYRSAPPFRTVS
ncbi:NTP pyrophosphatase (non-canonical NTP hydrolase) [Nocardia sp. GAS34]|uniref:MazG nucleotide pyrophosphohydrolase domain-containing protein n=1 Tax=unclassified Nocardia TaxID=2637762 RepID=UPI003D1F31FC